MARETIVHFLAEKYGNYQDSYYTNSYNELIASLREKIKFSWSGNIGFTDGVVIVNNFKGNFHDINCAIVEHEIQGVHLYKIVKKVFIRRDIWQITMIRDLVSSKYDEILNSKILVSRLGINRSILDPLLFIDEQMQLSEVKSNQLMLSELKGCKSYGYLLVWTRNSLDGTIEWESSEVASRNHDISVETLNDLPIYENNAPLKLLTEKKVEVAGAPLGAGPLIIGRLNTNYTQQYQVAVDHEKIIKSIASKPQNRYGISVLIDSNTDLNDNDVINRVRDILLTKSNGGVFVNNYQSYQGKIVFERSTGKYYKLTLEDAETFSNQFRFTEREVEKIVNLSSDYFEFTTIKPCYSLLEKTVRYRFTALPYTEKPLNHRFLGYSNVIDQPFQMMFIPVLEGGQFISGNDRFESNTIFVQHLLYDLITKYAGDNAKLIDIQVIPFAPIDGYSNSWNETTKVFNLNTSSVKETISLNGNIIPIFEVSYASYSKEIPLEILVDDYKISQKRKYILTSPSGAGTYDFSLSKNSGLEGFLIDVDLRPYSSFHRIQPIFKGMYGANFTDTRGLIWQEDTSLTQISNAWETYKRQNINYLKSFNADIDFRRSNQALQHEANWGNFGFDAGKRIIEAGVTATTFAAETVANDAWFGVKGGAAGAVGAGAIMGGAIAMEGIEAGQVAYNNHMESKMLNNEIDYTRQQFNYQLGSIRAIPENVEKVSGIFQTNMYVPYLQVFEPTSDEISYYTDYLDTYGVNVGTMVDLKSREFDFLQGTVIKYGGVITNEEYTELCSQLVRGVRKYKEV